MVEKYYLAYEDRYKQVHSNGSTWFSDNPTPELIDWITHFKIDKNDKICEVGCGEGRDTLNLSNLGYSVLGIDVSKSAVDKCIEIAKSKNLGAEFKVIDATELDKKLDYSYKWMYSIGTLHMLVKDNDRKNFLKSIYNRLEVGGHLLLVNMGDGINEKMTDIEEDFEFRETLQNGEDIDVKVIPFRAVNLDNHSRELEDIGFKIDDIKITENQNYGKCITVYASKF